MLIMIPSNLFASELSVEIKGIDDGIKTNKQQDYKEALLFAKREAIERAGTHMASITTIQDMVLQSDIIEEKSEAILLPGYKIIDIGYQKSGEYLIILVGSIKLVSDVGSFEQTYLSEQFKLGMSLYEVQEKLINLRYKFGVSFFSYKTVKNGGGFISTFYYKNTRDCSYSRALKTSFKDYKLTNVYSSVSAQKIDKHRNSTCNKIFGRMRALGIKEDFHIKYGNPSFTSSIENGERFVWKQEGYQLSFEHYEDNNRDAFVIEAELSDISKFIDNKSKDTRVNEKFMAALKMDMMKVKGKQAHKNGLFSLSNNYIEYEVAMEAEEFDRALHAMNNEIFENPESWDSFLKKGKILFFMRKESDAFIAFDRAVSLFRAKEASFGDSDSNQKGFNLFLAENLYWRGVAKLYTSKIVAEFFTAEKDFTEAISIYPVDIGSNINLSKYYIKRSGALYAQRKKEDACKDLNKACKLGDCKALKKAQADQYCKPN